MAGTEVKAQKKTGFFTGLQSEFKKVIWPDKIALVKQTIAVVSVSVVLGVIITIIDILVKYGVDFLVK